jgi:CrcB protein
MHGIWALVTHKLVLLSVGGAAGTNARYWLGHWINSQPWAGSWTFLGTFVINVSGSLVLGLTAGLLRDRLPPEQYEPWRLLIGVGFCGGYTTFSTFEHETFQLVRDGSAWLAFVNVVGSVGAGFLAMAVAHGFPFRR